MAGGEFRFGTASIYMAQRDNIQPNRTSQMRVITWTRFRRPQRHFLSTSAAFIVSARGKLGLWDQDDLEIAQSFRVSLLETILRQVDSTQREREAVIEHQNM